jgi:hypothetical protein
MSGMLLTLSTLPDTFAVCRLDPAAAIPAWVMHEGFFSITRTTDELSIVCREELAPSDIKCERGWRAFKLEGPFDFSLIGVLKSVLDPLTEARVGILAISTYDTDYVLVKAAQFEQALTVLTRAGHRVNTSTPNAPEIIEINCAWRLPNDSRARATFSAEIIAYDEKRDRWLVKLSSVQSTDATAGEVRELVEAQVGKWAYVPSEARRGLTLPLKYETLTGKIRWFYADDPRAPES